MKKYTLKDSDQIYSEAPYQNIYSNGWVVQCREGQGGTLKPQKPSNQGDEVDLNVKSKSIWT